MARKPKNVNPPPIADATPAEAPVATDPYVDGILARDADLQAGSTGLSAEQVMNDYPAARAVTFLFGCLEDAPTTYTQARLDAAEAVLLMPETPVGVTKLVGEWLESVMQNQRLELPHRVRAAKLLLKTAT